MNEITVAVIGIGNIGSSHAKHIFDGCVGGMKLTAVCDLDPVKLEWAWLQFGDTVRRYEDYHALLRDHLCEAIVIATPHNLHPVIASEALQAGYHVLSEKPAGVCTKNVRELNRIAAESGKVFAIMFNQRTNPLYQRVRQVVQSGALGAPRRLIWIITDWYRTQAYYDSGAWRATWRGEGGGVLLNQCPHQLDLWQWIFGMPSRIYAKCRVARYHNMEVEDDVTMQATYENGATACFITTTGEYPGTNRLEITGDLGKLVVEGQKLTHWKLSASVAEVTRTSPEAFATIPYTVEESTFEDCGPAHVGILQNFADAILHGTPLISPGTDGINALTISNAAFLSDWLGQEIALPLDEDLFEQMLQARIERSSMQKTPRPTKLADITGQYAARWHGKA